MSNVGQQKIYETVCISLTEKIQDCFIGGQVKLDCTFRVTGVFEPLVE